MSSSESNEDNVTISELLKDKKIFKSYRYNNQNIEKLYTAIKTDHIFTTEDFGHFINAAVNGGSNSFITQCESENESSEEEYGYKSAKNKKPKRLSKKYEIVQFMFTNFSPTDKQMKQLTQCYKKVNKYYTKYAWLDVLIKRDFKFNDLQLSMIGNIKYPNINKLFSDNTINSEMMKHYANIINDSKHSLITKEAEKVNEYDGTISFDLLKDFLNEIEYNTNNDLVIAIIRKSELNELIYAIIMNKNYTNYDLINIIIQKQKPTDEFAVWLCQTSVMSSHIDLLFQLITNEIIITEDMLNNLLNQSTLCYYDINLDFDFTKINVDFDKLMALNNKNQSSESSESTSGSIDSSEEEKPIKKKPCKRKPMKGKYVGNQSKDVITINTMDLFQLLNIPPSYETLKLICKNGYPAILKKFIATYPSLIPNKECLDASMTKPHEKIINDLLCYKLTPDKQTFNCLIENAGSYSQTQKNTEILIKHGLQITITEIEQLLSKDEHLDNLERFGIQYDEDLYFLCYKHDHYPQSYVDNFTINPDILALRELCKKPKTKLDIFINHIKTKNVQFDQYCVDNANIFGNYSLQNYFSSLDHNPSILAFIRTSTLYNNHSISINDIIKDIPLKSENMCKKFEFIEQMIE